MPEFPDRTGTEVKGSKEPGRNVRGEVSSVG